MQQFEELLETGYKFHGHKCPAMPMGLRAGLAAMKVLDVERSKDKELQVLADIPGIYNVHHIHLWYVDDQDIHFEAHVSTDCETLRKTIPIAEKIENLLHDLFEINHCTLQFETGTCLTGKFKRIPE